MANELGEALLSPREDVAAAGQQRPSGDEASALINTITEHHGMGWLAGQLGLSVRMLEQIRSGTVAVPATVQRLREIAQQGAARSGEPMKFRANSDRRW
jgi:hypothetical protein